MTPILAGLAAAYAVLRTAFLLAAVVLAGVLAADWAVRTRRLNPFGRVARFMRGSVDPLLAPVERRVVRAGGTPQSAPWWALAAVVLLGIVVLSLLQFLIGQLAYASIAARSGPAGIVRLLLTWTFGLLQIAIIVRVISSWVGGSPYSPWWRWSYTLSEPILRPLRRVVPTLGPIDITPIVAWFLLSILQSLVVGMV